MNKLKIEFKWAVYYTFLSIMWFQLEKSLKYHDEKMENYTIFSNLVYLVIFGVYFLYLLDKKKNFFNGIMSWQQGLLSGVILSVFTMILSPFAIYFKLKYVNPNFFSQMISASVSKGITLENAKAVYNLKTFITLGIVDCLSFGIIFAAVAAAIVKTKTSK